jgi:N-acetylglucosamine-6-phosphate deacetylase
VTTTQAHWSLVGCRVVTPGGIVDEGTITIADGRIAMVGATTTTRAATGMARDLRGLTLLPGFIDLHIHGAGGADAHAGEIAALATFLPRCGVTSFLPTLAADAEARTIAALRAIGATMAAQGEGAGGATVLGAHLEGPFLNPARAGAIAPEHMHPAEPDRLARLLAAAPGTVRLMTVAPDAPGALDLIPAIVAAGVVVSLGHTAADYALFRRAIDAGARHTTHLFNAMSGINHRAPGSAGAALTDERITIELIADGEHIHPAILALALHAKGTANVAIVSDAVGPAGLPAGEYTWFGRQVRSDGETVRLPDGTLAGSLGTLDRGLRTLLAPVPSGAGLALAEAAQCLATVPARILGLADRGTIAPGQIADLVAIDDAGAIRLTIVGGQIAYEG